MAPPKPAASEMLVMPAGEFTMGSSPDEGYEDERPQHAVTILAFAISRYEVTFDAWDACVADGGCKGYKPGDEGWGRGLRPVINVSWDDANAYVEWLSEVTGDTYRLPSEAEWEYAARAGTVTPFSLPSPEGSDDIRGKDLANCAGCGSEWDGRQTAPVGSFPANGFGLHDTAGNVWEWVEDCWHDSYADDAPDDGRAWLQEGQGDCGQRVLRGGSWSNVPEDLRSANCFGVGPDLRGSVVGFRVARTLSRSESVTP